VWESEINPKERINVMALCNKCRRKHTYWKFACGSPTEIIQWRMRYSTDTES
jgi:hypothetical protein